MWVGVLKEIIENESRVAMVPEIVKRLKKQKIDVLIEKGAGENAGFSDGDFINAGAQIENNKELVWKNSDVIFRLNPPAIAADGFDEMKHLRKGSLYFGFLNPVVLSEKSKLIAEAGVTAFSMELIPRTSRAQAMDALSSQANIAGYKAVMLAANNLKKLMPMLMTAAGTITPAKVLIIGAGVAGLQAIATARRLGAVVYGYDVRSVVREQVESLGAKFFEIKIDEAAEGVGGYAKELNKNSQETQRKALVDFASKMDVIVTTAQIPGKRAPLLLTKDIFSSMKRGSVIVDMAASSGGNVEGSRPGEEFEINGIKILGPMNLPALNPYDASSLYAKNLYALFELMIKEGKLEIDWSDDIIEGSCVSKDGVIVNKMVLEALNK